jgi:hypothetical protein
VRPLPEDDALPRGSESVTPPRWLDRRGGQAAEAAVSGWQPWQSASVMEWNDAATASRAF